MINVSLRSIPHQAQAKVDTTLLISTVREPKMIVTDVIDDMLKVQQSTLVRAQVLAHMVETSKREGEAAVEAEARVRIKMQNLHDK